MYQLSRNKGFSLIELLVVIAIFVIGLAVALPSLMNVGRRNVDKRCLVCGTHDSSRVK
jgi:prepilin-type N-terminal cleavage/methylation domain-containing protein